MKTNHRRNFKSNTNHKDVHLKGTSTDRKIFRIRYWSKFRSLTKKFLKMEKFEKIPIYKGDEYWSIT